MAHVLVCCDYLDFDTLFQLMLTDAGHTAKTVTPADLATALADRTATVVVTATAVPTEHPVHIARRVRPDVRIVVMSTWDAGTARDDFPEADVIVQCDGGADLPERLVAAVG